MILSNKHFAASLSAFTFLLFGASVAGADTIAGPTSWTVAGGSDTEWGIQFTALQNTTLTGFDFTHKDNSNPQNGDTGYRGTIELIDTTTTTTLYSYNYGTFPSAALIPFTGLDLALTSGDVYQLVDVPTVGGGNDEVYQYLSLNSPTLSYPDSNADISVTQGVFTTEPTYLPSNAWPAFSNINTTDVPEPGVYSLLAGLGVAGSIFLRRKRAR